MRIEAGEWKAPENTSGRATELEGAEEEEEEEGVESRSGAEVDGRICTWSGKTGACRGEGRGGDGETCGEGMEEESEGGRRWMVVRVVVAVDETRRERVRVGEGWWWWMRRGERG